MLFYFLLNICASISKYSGTITVPCPSIEHCLACYTMNEARCCFTCEKDYYPVQIWETDTFGDPQGVIICNKSTVPEISIPTPYPLQKKKTKSVAPYGGQAPLQALTLWIMNFEFLTLF